MSNLLENAIKYNVDGETIKIALRKKRGGSPEIIVSDDGPGIPESDRERVKDRFVRLDKSRSLPGSGLGLALVDAVSELHGAEFVMEDGFGTTEERPGLSSRLIFPRKNRAKV